MKDLSLLVKRIEGQTTILMQARNLNNYLLATLTGHESQGIVTQVSQKIQVVVGGLFQIVEEIRAHKLEASPVSDLVQPCQQGPVDHGAIAGFLSPVERADLGQLEHSYQELSIARDLVDRFRRRIISIGEQRRAGNDRRAD